MAIGIGSGSVPHGNRPRGWFMAVAVGSGESMNREDEGVGRWSKSPCYPGHFRVRRGYENRVLLGT